MAETESLKKDFEKEKISLKEEVFKLNDQNMEYQNLLKEKEEAKKG